MIVLSRSEAFGLLATLEEVVMVLLAAGLLVLALHAENGIALLVGRPFP